MTSTIIREAVGDLTTDRKECHVVETESEEEDGGME